MSPIDLLKEYAPYLIGAAAFVTTFWGQARNFVGYISSFVVVQSQHDEMITRALSWHLRANYRRPPSGLYIFRSIMLPIKISTMYRIIPFRMPSTTTAYWGPRGGFLFNAGSGNITGLRGFSRVEALVSDALDFYQEVSERDRQSPLIVVKVMGSMGDQFEQYRKHREEEGPAGRAATPSTVGSHDRGWSEPDLRIDQSFKYDATMFGTGGNVDPFRGLFYDKIALELVEDARRWRDNQRWYLDRGIPWRRGWMLEGPGGTGKSSMAKAVAQEQRLPIYQFYLSTLNDKEFIREWENMATPCMALFEDFDNVFDGRTALTKHEGLTFDCILNQIQGVSSINGVLLVITTNHIGKIDPALGQIDARGRATRPGRIDRIVHFGETDRGMREKIVAYIMPDFPDQHARLVADGDGTTPAQFQHMCIETVFSLLNRPNLQEAADD